MELNTTLYVNKNLYYIVSYEVKIKKKYCKSIVIDSSKLLHKRHRKIKSDENRKKEKKENILYKSDYYNYTWVIVTAYDVCCIYGRYNCISKFSPEWTIAAVISSLFRLLSLKNESVLNKLFCRCKANCLKLLVNQTKKIAPVPLSLCFLVSLISIV